MAKTDFKSVDDYIATHPEDVQAILQRVRSTIRKGHDLTGRVLVDDTEQTSWNSGRRRRPQARSLQ